MKHRLRCYQKIIGDYIFIYHEKITTLWIYKQKNGKKSLKHVELGVEVIKFTSDGWIFLKKNNKIGAIDFDGNKILPFKYTESIFKKKSNKKD